MTEPLSWDAIGPLFDGRAASEYESFEREATAQVAAQAFANVRTNLNASIKHPTPYYEVQVYVRHEELDTIISDHGVIYGPWLEGTGSRNQTTRFKGYASFRRAKQTTMEQVPRLVNAALQPFLRRMND